MDQQKYCSIDLEFTGFNPQVDQILEIGFVFFELTEQGIIETEKWSQIFQPTIEVHEKILGLTGLSLEQLAEAPRFSEEHREFLQQKLSEVVIVAHNPVLDIKFLESYGIKLSGKYIDTLDLAQILLPTHHSYNLENLMHYFGIVPADSHRALSDASSTIYLLDKLLALFYNLETSLQEQFKDLVKKGQFDWQEMFHLSEYKTSLVRTNNDNVENLAHNEPDEKLSIAYNQIISYGLQKNFEHRIAESLSDLEDKHLLVVRNREIAVSLWQKGLGEALFGEEELFSIENFTKFLESVESNDEVKFALKVLVWLNINWQTKTIVDLNLSFFGGQYRSFINGGSLQNHSETKLLICSYSDLSKSIHQKTFKDRRAVVVSMAELEQYFSSGNSRKVSWNMSLYLLRSVYNPESEYGQSDLKSEVMEAIIATDLFFSLLYILLHRHFPGQKYVTLEEILVDDYLLRRLKNMVFSFTQKLRKVSEKASVPALQNYIEQMEDSLISKDGIIKWIEVSEYNTSFKNQPLDLASEVQRHFSVFKSITFTERFIDAEWCNYLSERLGLQLAIKYSQEYQSLSCEIKSETQKPNSDFVEAVLQPENLPAIVLFSDLKTVKAFYDKHYHSLSAYSSVLAQGYSGGPNKLFRNFAIKDNSVLLISSDLMLKQQRQVEVRTSVINSLPNYDSHHPYNAAIISSHIGDKEKLAVTLRLGKILDLLNKTSSEKLVTLCIVANPNDQQFVDRIRALN